MKISIISDWHGDFELVNYIPQSDVICVCGDMVGRVSDFAYYPVWLEGLPAERVFVVPGNHDVLIKEDWDPQSNKVFNLANQTIKYKDIVFGGFCWCYTTSSSLETVWEYMTTNRKFLSQKVDDLKKCDVLVSHSPPAACDMPMFDGTDIGVPGLLEWAHKNECKYIFCGHVHEQSAVIRQFGDTEIINAACTLISFEINI